METTKLSSKGPLEDVPGCAGYGGPPKGVEERNQGIAAAIKARRDRG
jgi:hypothetical protein